MIYILSGDIRSGKTTSVYLASLRRTDVGGFLTPDHGDKRVLYDILNKTRYPFQVDNYIEHGVIKVGRFTFLKSAFQAGHDIIISQINRDDLNYIVVDEIGKLELKGKGFHELITMLVSSEINKDLIIIVRSFLLEEVIEKYGFRDFKIIEDINLVL